MIRISREQLAERWSLTYVQDGYRVRAAGVPGLEAVPAVGGVTPDIEASKDGARILVRIVASPDALEGESLQRELLALEQSRSVNEQLHLIVAAECAHDIKERLDAWHVHVDQVHIT